MSTFAEITAALWQLDVNELDALDKVLHQVIAARNNAAQPPLKQRILGMHRGAWEVADDFDAPLPDDFWLGNDK